MTGGGVGCGMKMPKGKSSPENHTTTLEPVLPPSDQSEPSEKGYSVNQDLESILFHPFHFQTLGLQLYRLGLGHKKNWRQIFCFPSVALSTDCVATCAQ